MNFIEEAVDILDLLYKHNWDERNGGNLSYIIKEEEVKSFLKEEKVIRKYYYDFDMSSIVGKYFKNCKKDSENNLCLFKILDKNTIRLLW